MKQTLVLQMFVDSLGIYFFLVMIKFTLLQPFLLIMFNFGIYNRLLLNIL